LPSPKVFYERFPRFERGCDDSLGRLGRSLTLPVKSVVIRKQVLDSILSYSKMFHPKEGILLLRGKTKGGVVDVDGVVIPPNAIHGSGFSAFGWGMIPIDLSYVGVAHSHPSGYAVPSHEDLLHVTGKIMVIAGAPYSDESCLKIYNVHGEPLRFEVKEGGSRPPLDESSDSEF
jgi:proteasome lid subunit RPN8/RPN11